MNLVSGICRDIHSEAVRERNHRGLRAQSCIAFLTYRCTSCCRTCTIWQREGSGVGELNRDQWLEIAAGLADYGVRSLELFGGDALLRKDVIFDLTAALTAAGIASYFPTNANLCDRDSAQRLIDAGLGTLYLSIDDVDELHDQVRGIPGSFSHVVQALEHFSELRDCVDSPQIVICSTLSSLNFRNFPKLLDFLRKYPITAVYPRPLGEFTAANVEASLLDGKYPEPYFSSSDGNSHLMSSEDLAEMRQMIREVKSRKYPFYVWWRSYYSTDDGTFLAGEYPVFPCRVATTVLTINPNGDVVPCPFFRSYVLGNLTREPLDRIWGNERHRAFVKAQQNEEIGICRNCNTRGYYPSLSETLTYYGRRLLERLGLRSL